MEDKLGNDYFLIAHVDLDQVQFAKNVELRFGYVHKHDDWDQLAKMMQSRKMKKPKKGKKSKEAIPSKKAIKAKKNRRK